MATETKKVEAFACGQCGAFHGARAEADACCCCSKCGGKFKKSYYSSGTCDGCKWGEQVREARREIRRAEDGVKTARERLSRLLANKPPRAAAVRPARRLAVVR